MRSRGLWYDDFFLIASWFLLLGSAISTTLNGPLGFGHHVQEVPLENVAQLGILSNISGTLSIFAVALSKTSFAITLLRISTGFWMRALIWFVIISLNITMDLSGIFFWVSCDPPGKTWNPMVEGTCWPMSVSVTYGIVVGGKDKPGILIARIRRPLLIVNSQRTPPLAIFSWPFCPGRSSYHSVCTGGEDWRGACNERRRAVSATVAPSSCRSP